MHLTTTHKELSRLCGWLYSYERAVYGGRYDKVITVTLEASDDGRLSSSIFTHQGRLALDIPAKVEEPGSCCVDVNTLRRYLKLLNGDLVQLKATSPLLELECGDISMRSGCYQEDRALSMSGDFLHAPVCAPGEELTWVPRLPGMDPLATAHKELPVGELAQLPGKDLWHMLHICTAAMPTDGQHYGLSGVNLENFRELEGLRMVATNGSTLHATATHDLPQRAPDDEFLVPASAASLLKTMAREREAWTVSCEYNRKAIGRGKGSPRQTRYLRFTAPGIDLCAVLEAAPFPAWTTVVPPISPKRLKVQIDRKKLLTALRRASRFGKSSGGLWGLVTELKSDGERVWGSDPATCIKVITSVGPHERLCEKVACEARAPFRMGFAPRLLVKALSLARVDGFDVGLGRPLGPLCIRDGDDLYVVMPVRLEDDED